MWRQPDRLSRTLPFPEYPVELQEKFSLGDLWLRSFGFFAADLEIDFTLAPRPLQETQILRSCTIDQSGSHPAADFFWDLEVGKRTQCLLIIAALSGQAEQLTLELRCPNLKCRQELEIEFSLAELVNLQSGGSQHEVIEVMVGTENLSFRKPTGKDQLEWLSRSFSDARTAVQAMADTLMSGSYSETPWRAGNLADAWIQDIGEVLAASDPLVNFKVRVRCPDCGSNEMHSLDLGALALDRLRSAQNRLLETIHSLARHYHWTEKEILEIPPWRRARYLALIEKEKVR